MPKGKLTPEGEVVATYGAAMVAAFQVLINCLEESDALLPGQFPDALGVYMEMVRAEKVASVKCRLPCSTTFGRPPWISQRLNSIFFCSSHWSTAQGQNIRFRNPPRLRISRFQDTLLGSKCEKSRYVTISAVGEARRLKSEL